MPPAQLELDSVDPSCLVGSAVAFPLSSNPHSDTVWGIEPAPSAKRKRSGPVSTLSPSVMLVGEGIVFTAQRARQLRR